MEDVFTVDPVANWPNFITSLRAFLAWMNATFLHPYHLDSLLLFVLLGATVAAFVHWFWKPRG